jgi:ABC-2 type transport system ATP-binding protein
MDENIVIKTQGLTKVYGDKAVVNGVNMNVAKGDIYGFIGSNGAGKTTFIRMLMGLIEPTSGTFELLGKSTGLCEIRKKIGCIVESPAIMYNMTASDSLKSHMMLYGLKDSEKRANLLNLVGLGDTGKKKVKDFSLGMKQRLAIAQALANDPNILILDEPTNGLDPQGIIEIRKLLQKLVKEFGITILISSHILSELQQFATRYGIIRDGQLIDEFTLEDLKKDGKTLEERYISKVGI